MEEGETKFSVRKKKDENAENDGSCHRTHRC